MTPKGSGVRQGQNKKRKLALMKISLVKSEHVGGVLGPSFRLPANFLKLFYGNLQRRGKNI
jgi:hypothetical protein